MCLQSTVGKMAIARTYVWRRWVSRAAKLMVRCAWDSDAPPSVDTSGPPLYDAVCRERMCTPHTRGASS
jgi:hypothetical protein